jgi:hypothetical protein
MGTSQSSDPRLAIWDRSDAEMAIALKREELNRALAYKVRYDADKHNICLALVRYKDGSSDVLAAYSNDSAIAESIRLGLNLIPDLYAYLPETKRFGCDGMAQYHTEPKLLNFLCADPAIRQVAIHRHLPRNPFYQAVLRDQRRQALQQTQLLRPPGEIAAVTLVTEIDCCTTCTAYSITRFREHYSQTPLHTIELGKDPGAGQRTQYTKVKITRT